MTGRSGRRLVVAVTGAAGPLGEAACRALVAAEGVRQVFGLDITRPTVPGVTFRRVDPADPGLVSSLSTVDALVHLAMDLDPGSDRAEQRRWNARSASVALTAAAAASIRRVVLVT